MPYRLLALFTLRRFTKGGKMEYSKVIKAYNTWSGIKQRCYNPNASSYRHYGGRGIKMCERWKENFESFYEDVSALPHFGEEGRTLDRENVNGDYEPNNCRWATAEEQANNTRRNVVIEFNGKVQSAAQWSREVGISENTICNRYKEGWSVERILTEPVWKRIAYNGKSLTISEWSKLTGIDKQTIRNRLNRGWSIEKSLTTPPRKPSWARPEVKEALNRYSSKV